MNENTQPIELSDSNLTKPENEPTKKDTIDFFKKMIAVREAIEKSNPDYYKKTEFIVTDLITIISVLEAMDDSEFEDYKKFNTHTKKEHEEFMKFIKKIEKQKNNILPILQSKLPEWHTMPIQKLATELQHDLINNGAVDLIVAGKGKKNEITSYVLATYDQPEAITMTGKPYTEFDRQVQDAVSSLWDLEDITEKAKKYGVSSDELIPFGDDITADDVEKCKDKFYYEVMKKIYIDQERKSS